jgi:OmpA-OmpF porin, OOP family
MKKILVISSFVVSTMVGAQKMNFNQASIDFGFGVNRSLSPVMSGKAKTINIGHTELAGRYMLNNKYGVLLGFGFEKYSATISNVKYSTNSFIITTQGVLNFTNIIDFNQISKKIGFYGHAGPSLVLNMAKDLKVDKIAGFTSGVTMQYKVSPKLALKGDVSFVGYLQVNRTLDTRYNASGGLQNGFDGVSGNSTIGLNYYLGDKAEHADWTPTNYGDAEAMAALKAKIEKAEKDMMDDDKDGVPNYLDQEPGTAAGANVDTKGRTIKVEKVVDMDGDGVLDVNDFCPTIPGSAAANGCPDKDGDGVYDFIDKCPNAAGLAIDGGCPVVKQKEKEIMQKAMTGVQFENGKATLIKKSTPILDQVAKVMLENPSYNLAINGHTDNVGDPGKNLQLSIDRAKSVKAYLMGKGVAESRLTSNGYGDTQPKVSNATAKGKATNRRVEFLVTFEK